MASSCSTTSRPDDFGGRAEAVTGDIADAATVRELIGGDTASVFHLAAVVSAGAEEDFELGYLVNLDGTRNVLEACRGLARPPRPVHNLAAVDSVGTESW